MICGGVCGGFRGDVLKEGNLRQRRQDDTEINGDVDLLAHFQFRFRPAPRAWEQIVQIPPFAMWP